MRKLLTLHRRAFLKQVAVLTVAAPIRRGVRRYFSIANSVRAVPTTEQLPEHLGWGRAVDSDTVSSLNGQDEVPAGL